MKSLTLTTLMFFFAFCVFTQTNFQYRYGTSYLDFATKIIQTQDHNFILVGKSNGFGSSGNALIMKVNLNGTILWVKDYSGINNDIIKDVTELEDKSLVMCGQTQSYGAGSDDAFIMKTDSIGNIIWAKAYGGIFAEWFGKVNKDGQNGFYVSGTVQLTPAYPESVIVNINSLGEIIWAKKISNNVYDSPVIYTLADGGVIVGTIENYFTLRKFSNTGNLVWSKNYTPTPEGSGLFGLDVIENSTGEIIVNTSFRNDNTIAQEVDNFVITLNASGNLISSKSYGGTYVDISVSINNTQDGGVILSGYTNSAGNGSDDVCLIKLNINGDIQWAKAYGTPWGEQPANVIETSDNGFAFTGVIDQGANPTSIKIYAVKTDEVGNSSCNDISWSPQILANHNLNITNASGASNHVFDERNDINWPLNSRQFSSLNVCNPLGVTYETIVYDSKVSPNPFSVSTTIKSNVLFSNSTLILRDVSGKIVKELQNISGESIELFRENLSSGIYFLYIMEDTDKVIVNYKLAIID